jgi:hypothetical protein
MLYIIYQKYFGIKVDKSDIQETVVTVPTIGFSTTNSNPRMGNSSVESKS